MRRVAAFFAVIATAGTGAAAWKVAERSVIELEARTQAEIDAALSDSDRWAEIGVNGLRVELSGVAPTEADRFQLLRRISEVVPARRVKDATTVSADQVVVPPEFSLQILRNLDDVSLIGIVPDGRATDRLTKDIADLAENGRVMDMLEAVAHEAPELWDASLAFGLEATRMFDRARVSIAAGEVGVTAIVASQDELNDVTEGLNTLKPEGVKLVLDLTAPRPVIEPFAFAARFDGARMVVEACAVSAAVTGQAVAERAEIVTRTGACVIGLGAPTPRWAGAITAGLDALEEMGGGTFRITDADVELTGPDGLDPVRFEMVKRDLKATLAEVFSLTATLPPQPVETTTAERVPPRFVAVRRTDGSVTITGDVMDEVMARSTETMAAAQFGFGSAAFDISERDDLPSGWSGYQVAGLRALGLLAEGSLEITENSLTVSGRSGDPEAASRIDALLANSLPLTFDISSDVTFDEALVVEDTPVIGIPHDLCAEQIEILLTGAQILFPPGETEIDVESLPIIDAIADILRRCPGARFEIAGHTDSQGRESSNMALSQARADAVLTALTERDITLVLLVSRGYGEEQPIAENDSEEGRALNRRIEFRLLPEPDTTDSGDGTTQADTPDNDTAATGDGAASGEEEAALPEADEPPQPEADTTSTEPPAPSAETSPQDLAVPETAPGDEALEDADTPAEVADEGHPPDGEPGADAADPAPGEAETGAEPVPVEGEDGDAESPPVAEADAQEPEASVPAGTELLPQARPPAEELSIIVEEPETPPSGGDAVSDAAPADVAPAHSAADGRDLEEDIADDATVVEDVSDDDLPAAPSEPAAGETLAEDGADSVPAPVADREQEAATGAAAEEIGGVGPGTASATIAPEAEPDAAAATAEDQDPAPEADTADVPEPDDGQEVGAGATPEGDGTDAAEAEPTPDVEVAAEPEPGADAAEDPDAEVEEAAPRPRPRIRRAGQLEDEN